MNLSGTASEELEKCISITLDLLNQAIEAFKAGSEEQAEQVFRNKKKINKAEKKFNKAHLNRVKNQQCDPGFVKLGEDARAFAAAAVAEGSTK